MFKTIEDFFYKRYMRAYLRAEEQDWVTMLRWRAFRVVRCARLGKWGDLFSMQTLFPKSE